MFTKTMLFSFMMIKLSEAEQLITHDRRGVCCLNSNNKGERGENIFLKAYHLSSFYYHKTIHLYLSVELKFMISSRNVKFFFKCPSLLNSQLLILRECSNSFFAFIFKDNFIFLVVECKIC